MIGSRMTKSIHKKTIAVDINRVTKTYQLHHEKPTLSDKLLFKANEEKFTAINNLSLVIYKGERVGIVGSNGAGKTTLLKLIAGITTPTSGNITTKGRIGSLINPSAGFHPDLSGIENISLNGLLIGMKKKEIESKLDSIISFADIGSFIDSPFYSYSDGMKLRLGFSVALHADPDIFIIDEGILAGDLNFQEKITNKLDLMLKQKKTIIVVSQVVYFLEKLCKRIILMEHGAILADGNKRVINQYKRLSSQTK